MTIKTSDVARVFKVTPQTVRNWTKHPALSEFFTAEARRDDKTAYAEFFASDIEVCNSIKSMLRKKAKWEEIAAQLDTGWRDTNLPPETAMLLPASEIPSGVKMMAELAITKERDHNKDIEIKQLQAELSTLRQKLEDERSLRDKVVVEKDHEIKRLESRLAEVEKELAVAAATAELELKLWRSGALKHNGAG